MSCAGSRWFGYTIYSMCGYVLYMLGTRVFHEGEEKRGLDDVRWWNLANDVFEQCSWEGYVGLSYCFIFKFNFEFNLELGIFFFENFSINFFYSFFVKSIFSQFFIRLLIFKKIRLIDFQKTNRFHLKSNDLKIKQFPSTFWLFFFFNVDKNWLFHGLIFEKKKTWNKFSSEILTSWCLRNRFQDDISTGFLRKLLVFRDFSIAFQSKCMLTDKFERGKSSLTGFKNQFYHETGSTLQLEMKKLSGFTFFVHFCVVIFFFGNNRNHRLVLEPVSGSAGELVSKTLCIAQWKINKPYYSNGITVGKWLRFYHMKDFHLWVIGNQFLRMIWTGFAKSFSWKMDICHEMKIIGVMLIGFFRLWWWVF